MRARTALCLAATMLLTACGSAVDAVPGRDASPPPTPAPSSSETRRVLVSTEPEPEPSPLTVAPARTELVPLRCGEEPLSGGFGLVEAALGTRIMRFSLLNCGDEAVALPAPMMRGLDSALVEQDLVVEATDGTSLAPGQMAQMELTWRGNGRCERGIQRLTMALGGREFVVEDCLQLGGDRAEPYEDGVDVRVRWLEGEQDAP